MALIQENKQLQDNIGAATSVEDIRLIAQNAAGSQGHRTARDSEGRFAKQPTGMVLLNESEKLNDALSKAGSAAEIAAILHQAAIAQGVATPDAYDPTVLHVTGTQPTQTEPQSHSFSKTEVIGGKSMKFEATSEAELTQQILEAHRVANQLQQIPANRVAEVAGVAEQVDDATRADLELKFRLGQITAEESAELRRRGMLVNHKRVLRMLREDNLLAVQPRAFVVTTDSDHEFEVYLNLASRMKLTGMNQLWVADITYIRLKKEFVYLAVVLDAFSRKVVGWALDRTLASRLPITALEQALAQRQPPPGLVHHSDRGVQYASGDYVKILRKHQMIPSMSRPANPYDNASCESFMKTLKREEIYANDYRDLDHLLGNIEAFIEQYYNRCRLHSALGYRSPEEFEREANTGVNPAGATMSFFRHGEIYQSDVGNSSGERPKSRSPAHRSDESPAGYSSASCSPAELASASPAERHPEGDEEV